MENPKHIKLLYEKYLNNDFSEQELDGLLEYFYNSGEHHELSEMIRTEMVNEETEYQSHPAVQALLAELDRDLFAEIEKRRVSVRTVRLWPRIAVAAAAVAAVTLGVWFYNTSHQSRLDVGNPGSAQYATDIAPGKNGATITLASGKVIQLSDKKLGVVVGKEIKYDDGTALSGLQGHPDVKSGGGMTLTASTAKGQTYQFTLADGTKVWLNADSKLEFPSKFVNSKTRFVKLSGEGYFEVAKDKAHPFIVATDKQEVEVLGTHFNINAYKDESNIRTTLLEGSVRVGRGSPGKSGQVTPEGERSVILKPNQQSVLSASGQLQVKEVDPNEATAWKSGIFDFEDETLGELMRKVARWYNVEVEYGNKNLASLEFTGTISRYDKVSKLLAILETTNSVHFKIEDRKIKVTR